LNSCHKALRLPKRESQQLAILILDSQWKLENSSNLNCSKPDSTRKNKKVTFEWIVNSSASHSVLSFHHFFSRLFFEERFVHYLMNSFASDILHVGSSSILSLRHRAGAYSSIAIGLDFNVFVIWLNCRISSHNCFNPWHCLSRFSGQPKLMCFLIGVFVSCKFVCLLLEDLKSVDFSETAGLVNGFEYDCSWSILRLRWLDLSLWLKSHHRILIALSGRGSPSPLR